MPLWTQADLENAMSPATVVAIFDDVNDGTVSEAALTAVAERADATIYSFIRRNYPGLTMPVGDTPVPDSLKFASLEFGIVFARDRKPEYWSKSQEHERDSRIKMAYEMAKRFAEALQIIYDAGVTPANVGAFVSNGNSLEPDVRPRVFDNTGDF